MESSISIDSLKIRIPMSKVEILDQSIFGNKIVIDDLTGNVEREFKENRYKVKYDGITTSFGIEHQNSKGNKVVEYFVILLNSKLLHQRYFEGITQDTVETVYLRIMGMNVAKFDFDTFLDAECTDVDFKQDLQQPNFSKTLDYINSHAKLSKNVGEGSNKRDQPTNKGIEFGKRETAHKSYPYLKFYHKGLELLNSSKTFYGKYIADLDIDVTHMVRVETTVKNKKHFAKLGVDNTSLRNILKLSQDKLLEIVSTAINRHLEKRLTTITPTKELKPMDRVYFNSMALLIDQGANYHLVVEMLLNGINGKVQRSRVRKTLDRIYNENIRGSEGDQVANELADFCAAVGWV